MIVLEFPFFQPCIVSRSCMIPLSGLVWLLGLFGVVVVPGMREITVPMSHVS